MEIRPARPDEARALSKLARAAKASWGYPAEWLSAWKPTLTITPQSLERGPVFVAVDDTEIVGFYALEQGEGHWSLEHLWVEPRWHGRGIGRRLFEHALGQVPGARPAILRIESDPHAAEFYRRMGARQVGTLAAPVESCPERVLPIFEIEAAAD